ncbi:hypothetical protein [Paenibacillus xylanexedens]|uniref:hypothetical protein n=1 Tax=Paenibacillus xylanexedens TaxID=528191 RepID=UPI0011A5C7D6|nr:hypothetical protein [Paenibacillus xylanexedens]
MEMEVVMCKMVNFVEIVGRDVFVVVGGRLVEFGEEGEGGFGEFGDGREKLGSLEMVKMIGD